MQLKIIGTNSLAMMLEFDHSGGHCHCNHCVLNTAPQPHKPEASVCIDKSEVVLSAGWRNMLSLFHCRKVCHHIKSDLNSLFSLVSKCKNFPFVAFLFFNHVSSFTWICVSFSCGSLISICWVSRIIPRNVKVVDGPSTLLGGKELPARCTIL